VVSDFPELQMKSVGFRAPAGGSINGGGPVLDLMTNGAVYLKRVK
jgi:hypothetical protein